MPLTVKEVSIRLDNLSKSIFESETPLYSRIISVGQLMMLLDILGVLEFEVYNALSEVSSIYQLQIEDKEAPDFLILDQHKEVIQSFVKDLLR